MFAVVSPDGRYHGHTQDRSSAQKLESVLKNADTRLLSESEWDKVVKAPRSERAELCSTLGSPAK